MSIKDTVNKANNDTIQEEKAKEDDAMDALAQYLEVNREKAYAIATANTTCNNQGRPVITKEDEWIQEIEWDSLYQELLQKNRGKDTNA